MVYIWSHHIIGLSIECYIDFNTREHAYKSKESVGE